MTWTISSPTAFPVGALGTTALMYCDLVPQTPTMSLQGFPGACQRVERYLMIDEDTPETIHECPVCEEGLPLKRMAQHLGDHIRLNKDLITAENETYIRGLLDVVKEVVDKRRDTRRTEKPVEVRKRYFTHYWSNATWQREAARDDLLEHTAGNQFKKKRLRCGDEIYIITVLNGKIMLGGKIFVDQVVSQQAAARVFGVEPGELWDAKEHVIAGDEYTYSFDPNNEVPWDVAKGIKFINSDGQRGLKRARDGSGIDPQTIRGVCELTKYSAMQLDRLL
ncbi:MAG: hypothetical protein V7742_12220 [Halioglobus sp.]